MCCHICFALFPEIDCGTPSTYSHSSRVFDGTNYLDEALYTCNMGYEMASSGMSQINSSCAIDGTWSAIEQCQGEITCTNGFLMAVSLL